MMAGRGAVADRIERGLIVGAWSVEIGIATPAPGESLSSAARRLAERVVAEVTGLPVAGVRVASLLPSGRPIVASDDGLLALAVSVAHERRLVCAAVCAGAGIGIDVVDISAARAGLDSWLNDAERAAASTAMIWAAKEAAYKAAGLDAVFRPLGVAVEPSDDGTFAWTLRDDWRTVSGMGRFLEVGCHLVAVACTHTPRRPTSDRLEARSPTDQDTAPAGAGAPGSPQTPPVVAACGGVDAARPAVHPHPTVSSSQEQHS
jgi:4'-phosphopantetheinyl transferase EntD